jgi:hypothetical protein
MLQVSFNGVSNREQWDNVTFVVDQDGTLYDLSTATIVVALRNRTSKHNMRTLGVGDGITVPSPGIFIFTFTEDQMRDLDASFVYEIGCTIRLNGSTQQFFTGTVSVLDGIVE